MIALEGVAHAEQRRLEREVVLAYNIMAIDRDNQSGWVKPLSKYLDAIRRDVAKTQTADEVAGVFLALKAKGKSVKIREVPRRA